MIQSFIDLILALLGLSILVFIHELGHYWMARREGMTVEIFSIGFGKPIRVWEHRGVKWQLCWLPFGGYVRIAGMEKKGYLEPYQIPDGFYGKKPWSRIKVALAGPIVNMLFALFIFSLLWVMGGRIKHFSEYTQMIGWLDQGSGLYSTGVRSGDEINTLNGKYFNGFNDFIYASIFDEANLKIQGTEIDYFTQNKQPFTYTFQEGEHLKGIERARLISETLYPAQYLIYYTHNEDGSDNSLLKGSPMYSSGVQDGDRLVWADGELIFSRKQLIATINEPKALVTVKRGEKSFLARVPRLKISDLRLNSVQQAELSDWQYAAALKEKMNQLFFIPYDLSANCQIEGPLPYLNEEVQEQLPTPTARSQLENPLQAGDQILAIDGIPVTHPSEMLKQLQERKIQMIVQQKGKLPLVSWKKADRLYFEGINWNELSEIITTIGTDDPIRTVGSLRLLNPVSPRPFNELPFDEKLRAKLNKSYEEQKKTIEAIEDPQERATLLQMLENEQKRLMVGISFGDRSVRYNPSPITQFFGVFNEVRKTLVALFTGHMSPKSLAGPIGIVQVMHHTWMVGIKEALYWLAFVSLNLGIVNLLPIPVLDGGHICFSLWEAVTKKRIKAKTMERLIIPFIILIVLLFIYMTYHDVMRLLGKYFW
jgi:regulator of sigma E protease